MELQIPVYREVEGLFLCERIEDCVAGEGLTPKTTYEREAGKLKDTRVIYWDTGMGTIPIYQPEISSPYGAEPVGYLSIAVEGAKDELQLMRRLSLILNERPIVFSKHEIDNINQTFDRWHAQQPLAGTIHQIEYWNAVDTSWRILARAVHELSVLNQFIHLWRSFNALYTYYYKADTGKDPHKNHVGEEAMFNYFLQKFFPSSAEAKPIVELFLSRYDLRWMLDLELDAKRMTKEGYLELVKKGIIKKVNEKEEKHEWLFEGIDWKELLNFRGGLNFWKYYERRRFQQALKELVAFIYDTGRNKVFHGSEPFFTEEEIAFYHASVETLYRLLMVSLPKALKKGPTYSNKGGN